MAKKEDSKQDKPINWTQLSIQELEEITKHAITNQNYTFYGLNQQLLNNMKSSDQDAEYTKEEILQMREKNDKILYKSPAEIITSYGCAWENGKVGYFIPFDHEPLGLDFLPPQFGGGRSDGKGLRFVQSHKNNDKTFLLTQKNQIILSGFGEYVLTHWGQNLDELYVKYTNIKYKKLAEKWKNEHFPTKIDTLAKLNLLKELKNLELEKWHNATISSFLTTTDNDKLNQCMNGYFTWFDKCLQVEESKGEQEYIKNIKSGTITCGNGWVNSKSGQFRDFENDYQLRFCETDANGYHYLKNEVEQRKSPVLACGFVAWLIKHWGDDTVSIFNGYLQFRLNQYKSEHKNDADVFKRDLDTEFYKQYKPKEEERVKQSEALFDFISELEVKRIKEYILCYFEYVYELSNPLKIVEYTKESEILKCTTPYIKQIFFALKKYTDNGDFSPMVIINDLRRIEQYHETNPDECIAFIAEKYNMRWAVGTRFIVCLKLIIDAQSDFLFLLSNQQFMNLLNENVQNDLLEKIEVSPAEKNRNNNESIEKKPQQLIETLIKQPEEREIKKDVLGSYFNPSFRGIGENNINYFESLIEDLKKKRSAIEFGEIALMIFESNCKNDRMPLHFSDWYPVFCDCVGCEMKKYEPKDLRPARENLKKLFSYLLL